LIGQAARRAEAAAARAFGGDARLLTACHGPLALPLALGALGREAGLPWPAKLVRRGGLAALLAEVPRLLARRDCEELASSALDAALAWLVRGAPAGAPEAGAPASGAAGGSENAARSENAAGSEDARVSAGATAAAGGAELHGWVAAAAAALGFRAEMAEEGGERVYATPAGRPASRLRVARAAGGALLVSSATSVRLRAPRAAQALPLFALEASGRLRLARITVLPAAGAMRIAWEAVLPAALPPEPALACALEAVALARAETARLFAALAEAEVADAYLALRGTAPAARQKHAGTAPAHASGARPREHGHDQNDQREEREG
jgi:hypothetical protein